MVSNVGRDEVRQFLRELARKGLSSAEQLIEMERWRSDHILTAPAKEVLDQAAGQLKRILSSRPVVVAEPPSKPERCVVACAAVIKEKKILIVEKEDVWILPGGKKKPEESEVQCLVREGKEELSEALLANFRPYRNFTGVTPNSNRPLEVQVFFADVESWFFPSGEITAVMWTGTPERFSLSNVTATIVHALRTDERL